MARVNEHYLALEAGYLFPEIARRVRAFAESNPGERIIRLGIGDVTRPLPPAVVEAFRRAVEELADARTFRGYGPEQGYDFLIEAVIERAYAPLGVRLSPAEVFVSDGSKCDTANILDIFALDNRVAITDPVYPVYNDTNIMVGRRAGPSAEGSASILYLPCTEENGFVPEPPRERVDLVYLCFPNNPTGAVAAKDQLARWVEYALANETVILFDAAYEAFVTEPHYPRSIYEIEGARRCAVEFRSFSKTAGFTGVRCALTVVPEELAASTRDGRKVPLNRLWNRRQTTKFNGVSYPVQRAAAAVYSEEGWRQTRENIDYYMENARLIRQGLSAAGFTVYGGVNAPYIWLRTPGRLTSWEFFDRLLRQCRVVGTPGSGFGPSGEGFLRLSAFGDRDDVAEAVERIRRNLG